MARDEFIRTLGRAKLPALFVFNTQSSSRSGEHWMAAHLSVGRCYYFDSYGRPPTHYPDLYYALRTRFTNVESNPIRLQGPTTTTCGDYCVLFCLLVARGWSEQRFVNRLALLPGFEARDHAIRETLLSMYGADSYHTLRRVYPDLVGQHNIHIKPALLSLLQNNAS